MGLASDRAARRASNAAHAEPSRTDPDRIDTRPPARTSPVTLAVPDRVTFPDARTRPTPRRPRFNRQVTVDHQHASAPPRRMHSRATVHQSRPATKAACPWRRLSRSHLVVGQPLQHWTAEPAQSNPGKVGAVLSRTPCGRRRQGTADRDDTGSEGAAQRGKIVAPPEPSTPAQDRVRADLRPWFSLKRRAFHNRAVGGNTHLGIHPPDQPPPAHWGIAFRDGLADEHMDLSREAQVHDSLRSSPSKRSAQKLARGVSYLRRGEAARSAQRDLHGVTRSRVSGEHISTRRSRTQLADRSG